MVTAVPREVTGASRREFEGGDWQVDYIKPRVREFSFPNARNALIHV